jgi:hypothetical protein
MSAGFSTIRNVGFLFYGDEAVDEGSVSKERKNAFLSFG